MRPPSLSAILCSGDPTAVARRGFPHLPLSALPPACPRCLSGCNQAGAQPRKDILSGNRPDPVDFTPAPPANAHSERPRSSVASCASHHAGLFRHSSFGQASQSVAAHPAQYCFWKARSHGASNTGNSRRKAANACGLSVIRSYSVTVLTSLHSRGRRPAPPLEMLLNGCLRPLCFVDFPLPAVQLPDVPPL